MIFATDPKLSCTYALYRLNKLHYRIKSEINLRSPKSDAMSSSLEVVASEPDPSAPCAGCKHLRRRCLPNCVFAPYFSADDRARFAAVHRIFGASNVSKLLAELPPEQRADVVESLVFEAEARLQDPSAGCISYISLLQNMAEHVTGCIAAAREELAGYVGREAAFQPFVDPAAAPASARLAGAASMAAALQFAREQDEAIRAEMQAQAGGEAAAKQSRDPHVAATDAGDGPGHQQMVEAQHQQAALMVQQATAAEVARERDLMMRQAAMEQYQYAVMAQAQQLAAAEEIRQAAAGAGLTPDQYMMTMMQQQAVAGQQRHDQAQQHAAMAFDVTLGHVDHLDLQLQQKMAWQISNAQQLSAAAEAAGKQDLIMMQQQVARDVPASGSGATIMPFLAGGSANVDAMLAQQQQQSQPQTVNALGSQAEPSLPPLPPSLADLPQQQAAK